MLLYDKKKALTHILGKVPAEGEVEGGDESPLKTCVSEFIDAVHAKDVEAATSALKACFSALEAEPHKEGPHLED